jgi:Transglutaminase-like superfamily
VSLLKKIITNTLVLLLMLLIHIGCSPGVKVKYPEEIIMSTLPENLQDYAMFLRQNMEGINEKYSREYIPFNFEVDTDYGSTLIQTFIDPEAVSSITHHLGINNLGYKEKISVIYNYVIHGYSFIIDPYGWQTVKETIKTKKGDCKSLSLLLMSLFLSAGIDSHVAVSNGHMWTNVFYDNTWHVLEVDMDPDRNKIYQIPGFYENPLYKVYIDHTERRKRIQGHING